MQLTTERVRLNSREVKRIYFEASPRRERMPFPLMVAMSWLWNTQFLSFAREGRTQGFVYLARGMGMVFVMFLAVDGELRGQGCGSAILAQVRRRNPGRRIVVTIEPCDAGAPDLELRRRRRAFYLRNGFVPAGHRIRLSGVEQEALVAGGAFSRARLRLFLALYSCGTLWPRIWRQEETD